MSQKDSKSTLIIKSSGAGAISGIITKTTVAPLERIKILYQLQGMMGPEKRYNSLFGSAQTIIKEEGFRGLFRGNGANIARILPNYTLKFMFNDTYKRAVCRSGQSLKEMSFTQLIQAGWLAGVSQASITYPLDMVRTRLTMDNKMSGGHRGILGTLKNCVQTEGIRGLYKGYSMTFLSTPVYIGLQMSLFDIFKRQLADSEGNTHPVRSFVAGACAGLIAQSTAYPGDTIRKQLQSNGMGGKEKQYSGLLDCIRQIYKRGGMKGFYPGIGVNTIKCIPEAGLQFVIYDQVRAAMDL